MLERFFKKREPATLRPLPAIKLPEEVRRASIDNDASYRREVEKLADVQRREQEARSRYYALAKPAAKHSASDAAAAVLAGEDVAGLAVVQGNSAGDREAAYKAWTVLQRAVELQKKRVERAREIAAVEVAKPLRPWFIERYAELSIHLKRAALLADELSEAIDHLHGQGAHLAPVVRPMPVHPWVSFQNRAGFLGWLAELSHFEPQALTLARQIEAELVGDTEEEVQRASA